MTRPVCLVVLDGLGIGTGDSGDATALADTPFFARCNQIYPHARIETSGCAVGLPDGQMGNSEIGHMTLGAGRIIDPDLKRISSAIDSGELEQSPGVARTLEAAASSGQLHLLGLVSTGGVHSSMDHLYGLLSVVERAGIRPVIHAFTDGRDTPPRSALEWIEPLEARVAELGGCIATVSGRYWAMDRDQRWDRIALAYRAIVARQGEAAGSAVEAVEKAHARDEGDEFIRPSVIGDAPALADGDAALFFNFRADRARELTNALTRSVPDLLGREITDLASVEPRAFVTLTVYDEKFELPALFEPVEIRASLGELVSSAGLRQLRVAETEKYAHVTYFFNGGVENPFSGEDRRLIPSPRDIPTYDLKPEMSAVEITDTVVAALDEEDYAFILVNFANPDMVGHTGVLAASVQALKVVDACLDRLASTVLARGGTLVITADHGNIEQLLDPETGQPHTAHTTNPVPLWWVVADPEGLSIRDGSLSDIAPTVCALLDLEPGPEMTGGSLIPCSRNSSSS